MPQAFRSTHALMLCFMVVAAFGQTPIVREVGSPAGPQSGEPNLSRAADGQVYLSWIEKTADQRHTLRFAVRTHNGWTEARKVAEGENWFVNWADFPSIIALPGGAMAAHWLSKSGTDTYAYDVNIARSADAGKTWAKPIVPHRDGTKTEHGFVSMLALAADRLAAVWLDGRKFTSKGDSHGGHGSTSDEMTLRYASLDARGQLAEEAELDGRVCECCQTSAALTTEGVIVAYRDRSEKEVRDISIVRQVKRGWTTPRVVYADGWEINGCPVNGPSVAASGRRVAVAWFTAAKETPRVKVAFSSNAGATFGEPVIADDGNALGRVEVLMLEGGEALVVWMERTPAGAEVRARRVRQDGSRGHAITVAQSIAARSSGFPQIARSAGEIIFAWTAADNPPRVRTAVMKLEDYR
jgi:hypothetical protein